MSKKMMKRSLVLGALMAFVITGSAFAAELNIVDQNTYDNLDNTIKHTNGIYIENSYNNNTVTIGKTDGTGPVMTTGNTFLYGAYYEKQDNGDITANDNVVNFNAGHTDYIYGVRIYAKEGDAYANNNIFNINGAGKVKSGLYGVMVNAKDSVVANNNKINILDVSEEQNIDCSTIYNVHLGSIGVEAEAVGNEIVVNNSKIKSAIENIGINADEIVRAEDNKLKIINSTVDGDIYCVHSVSNNSSGTTIIANIKNNIVEIDNSTVKNVYGAYVEGIADENISIVAEDNVVNIKGNTTVKGNVYGSYAKPIYSDYSSANTSITSSGNIVNIISGIVEGDIYGGYTANNPEWTSNRPGVESGIKTNITENNTVNLMGGRLKVLCMQDIVM